MIRSPLAERDLDGIWDHVAQHDPLAADRLLDRLSAKLHRLTVYPGIGRSHPDMDGGLRSVVAGNYVIIYRPIDDGIEVVRVLHGARDIAATLPRD